MTSVPVDIRLPLIFDVWMHPSHNGQKRGFALDHMSLSIPVYMSLAELHAGGVKRAGLEIGLDWPGLGLRPEQTVDESYFITEDGTLLSPWHGNIPYWRQLSFETFRDMGPADFSNEFSNMFEYGVSTGAITYALTPGYPHVFGARELPIPYEDLSGIRVTSTYRDEIVQQAADYWSNVHIIGDTIYGPSAGPAWIALESEVLLIDNARLAPPDARWIQPLADADPMLPPSMPSHLPLRGEIYSAGGPFPRPDRLRLNLSIIDREIGKIADQIGYEDVSPELWRDINSWHKRRVDDYYSMAPLTDEEVEAQTREIRMFLDIPGFALPGWAMAATDKWLGLAEDRLKNAPAPQQGVA